MPRPSKADNYARKRHEANLVAQAEYPLRMRICELEREAKAAESRAATAEAERDSYRDAYRAMVRLAACLDSGKVGT